MNNVRLIIGSGLVAALLALGAPARAAGVEVDERYEPHPRRALLRGGGWTLGASYAAAFVAAAASERSVDNWLYVPLAGPWLALGEGDGEGGGLRQGLLIADGVVQTAGVMQLAGAFMFPELHRVTVEHERDSEPPSFVLRAEPWVQGKTVGLRARAMF